VYLSIYLYLYLYLYIYGIYIYLYIYVCFVNKPLSAAGILEDSLMLKDCLKNKQVAEKQSFKGNFEILRTIFQPRALSSDIPASRKGVYLFNNAPNYFSRPVHIDRSCIFCGFCFVSRYRIFNQLYINLSLASAKSFLWFSLTI